MDAISTKCKEASVSDFRYFIISRAETITRIHNAKSSRVGFIADELRK
jgi:hypothetical protein